MSMYETISHTLHVTFDGPIFSSSDKDFLSSLTVKDLISYLFSLPASYITCSYTVFLDDSQSNYSITDFWHDSIDFDYSLLSTLFEKFNLSDLINFLQGLDPLSISITKLEFFS